MDSVWLNNQCQKTELIESRDIELNVHSTMWCLVFVQKSNLPNLKKTNKKTDAEQKNK